MRGEYVDAYVFCDVCKDGKIIKIKGIYDDSIKTIRVEPSEGHWRTYYHKNDFSFDRETAVEKANKMLERKVVSLEKKLSFIKGLEVVIEENEIDV